MDALPKQICSLCNAGFDMYEKFFTQVVEAEKKLLSLFNEVKLSHNEKSGCVECPLCAEGSMSVTEGRIILGSESKNRANRTLGQVDNDCLVQMIQKELEQDSLPSSERDDLSNPALDIKYEFSCFTCGQGVTEECEIPNHQCSNILPDFSLVQRPRKRTKVVDDGPTQCDICGKKCKSHKSLKDHIGFCHPQVFHKCEICGLKFAKRWLLNNHLRKHTGEMPYACTICGKDFISSSHLWNHNNFHHSERNLKCHICNTTGFYMKQDLDNHIRTKHTKERKYHCVTCNKSFMSSSVFYQHRFIHTDIRKYRCSHCSKAFRRWETLHNHIRIHTGERPYACDLCGRAFRQRGDMKKHRATQHASNTL